MLLLSCQTKLSMTPCVLKLQLLQRKPRFSSRAFSSSAFIVHQVDVKWLHELSIQCVDLPCTPTLANLATTASWCWKILYICTNNCQNLLHVDKAIEMKTKQRSVRLLEAENEMHALSLFCAIWLLTNGCSVSRVLSPRFLDDILVFVTAMLPGIILYPNGIASTFWFLLSLPHLPGTTPLVCHFSYSISLLGF